MNLSRLLALSLVAAAAAWFAAEASPYAYIGTKMPQNDGKVIWQESGMTYRIHNGVAAMPSNVIPGSDPVGAIRQGLTELNSISAFRFNYGGPTAIGDATYNDGVSIVSFHPSDSNHARLTGRPVMTLVTFTGTNRIVDVDILFSKDYDFTTLKGAGTPRQAEALPLLMGVRALGLYAMGVENSAMLPSLNWVMLGGRRAGHEVGALDLGPTPDDIAVANVLYPDPAYTAGRGTIGGTVELLGKRVYGAHVVAVNADTGVVQGSYLTPGSNQPTRNGVYKIEMLPAGRYWIYVEPIDEPISSSNWSGVYSLGDFWGGSFTPGYRTVWHGGATRQMVTVPKGGGVVSLGLTVPAGEPTIVPVLLGALPAGDPAGGAALAAQVAEAANNHSPVMLGAGEARRLAVVGAGVGGGRARRRLAPTRGGGGGRGGRAGGRGGGRGGISSRRAGSR